MKGHLQPPGCRLTACHRDRGIYFQQDNLSLSSFDSSINDGDWYSTASLYQFALFLFWVGFISKFANYWESTIDMISTLVNCSPIALMLAQSSMFLLVWGALRAYVVYHGSIQGAYKIIRLNSLFYSVVSAALLIIILLPSYDTPARYLYHMSKFYEYVDIMNVQAAGSPISIHFGFHHLTTPYLTFFRVISNSRGWRIFAALNAFHHVLMYGYFGGVGWVRPALPWTGTLQLIAGIVVEAWILRSKSISAHSETTAMAPNWIALGLLTSYLVLNTREILLTRKTKEVKSKES